MNKLKSGVDGVLSKVKNNILLRKFLSFSIGNWVVLVIGLISTPLITRIINPTEYGKFGMLNLYSSILLLLITCGLDQAYVRFFYQEEEKNRNKLLLESIKIPIIINVVLVFVILIFRVPISRYIIHEYNLNFIILLIVNAISLTFNRFTLLTVRMKQKGKLYSLLQIVQKVTYLVTIGLFFFMYSDSFMTLALATLASNVIIALIAFYTERDTWGFKGTKEIKLKNSRNQIIKYGVPLAFNGFIIWMFQSADKTAISRYGSLADVGVYNSAMSIISILNILQSSFNNFWVPVSFEKYEKKPEDVRFFSNINEIVTISMFVVGIGVILFKDVIVMLLGSEYRSATFIMPFLIFMPVLYTMSEVSVVGINFKNKPKYHVVIATMACIVNVIGCNILVPIIGAKGAAISTGLSYIVFYYGRTLISKRLYKVDYQLGRTTLVIVAMVILATYSSFYSFTIITAILGILNFSLIGFLYRKTIMELMAKVKKII